MSENLLLIQFPEERQDALLRTITRIKDIGMSPSKQVSNVTVHIEKNGQFAKYESKGYRVIPSTHRLVLTGELSIYYGFQLIEIIYNPRLEVLFEEYFRTNDKVEKIEILGQIRRELMIREYPNGEKIKLIVENLISLRREYLNNPKISIKGEIIKLENELKEIFGGQG